MKKIYTAALCCAFFLFFSTINFAQDFNFSNDQIVGKWNLTSASFNGTHVELGKLERHLSFEFSNTGQVTLIKPDGNIERGQYLIEDNRLIDSESPEYLDAQIIALSNDELILSMYEDHNEVVMVFELEGYASK